MAQFNFSSFVVRGFDMSIVQNDGLSQFRIAGFSSYDEAHAYAQRVFKNKQLRPFLDHSRILLISKENLDLLGSVFSFNDYQAFFDRTFVPLRLPANVPIETAPIEQHYEDEYTPEELERINSSQGTDNNGSDDDGEWY